jgi:hypothetical protein
MVHICVFGSRLYLFRRRVTIIPPDEMNSSIMYTLHHARGYLLDNTAQHVQDALGGDQTECAELKHARDVHGDSLQTLLQYLYFENVIRRIRYEQTLTENA